MAWQIIAPEGTQISVSTTLLMTTMMHVPWQIIAIICQLMHHCGHSSEGSCRVLYNYPDMMCAWQIIAPEGHTEISVSTLTTSLRTMTTMMHVAWLRLLHQKVPGTTTLIVVIDSEGSCRVLTDICVPSGAMICQAHAPEGTQISVG